MRSLLSGTIVLLLLGYFWWQGERFLEANGPTFDECVHISAGYGYWMTGDFRMNHEDPPLLKLWWALPLVLGDRPAYPRDLQLESGHDHWKVGVAFLYESGVPHQQLLKPSRRMNLVLGCGIVMLAGVWSYRLWGHRMAALAASAFAAFDPNLLALSCVLSTDAGFAFFALISAYLLWEYVDHPSRSLLYAAGISLGLMLGTKLSAIAMVGGFGLAGMVAVLRGGPLALPGQMPKGFRTALDLAFRLGVIAMITLAATYEFVHFDEWGRGLKFQLTRGEHGDGRMYLNGELSKTGWYEYFLVALALKASLGLIVAALGGALVIAGRAALHSEDSASRRNGRALDRFLGFGIPPVAFFVVASLSRVDMGIRVVLPAVVFLYMLAAGLAVTGRCHCVRTGLLVACLIGNAIASWQSAPNQIAYFNELSGGHGSNYLADSNLDWGQGLPRLKDYMDREQIDVLYLSFFGTDRPEAYGIRFAALPGYGRIGAAGGEIVPLDAHKHILAISFNNLIGLNLPDPKLYAFLRSRAPIAIVAGSIWIFDLTGDEDDLHRIRGLTSH